MKKTRRFAIERSNLSAYTTTDLKGMANFVHTADELVAQANISVGYEPLKDLEDALADDLFAISHVLLRIEKRLAVELARRTDAGQSVPVIA